MHLAEKILLMQPLTFRGDYPWTRFRRHSHQGRLYLNFAGQDEDSGDLTKVAFGRNFDLLAAIKHRYDPGNMFRFNQNIKPAGLVQ